MDSDEVKRRKLTEPRIRVGTYISESVIEKMDIHVLRMKRESRNYSRSDLLNEAVEFYLEKLGEE